MQNSLTQETLALISKDFEVPTESESLQEEHAIEWVANAIKGLLDRDFERLLQICYRIDLGEAKLKKILSESEPDEVATDLAKALWDRQKQKVEIRRKYS